MASSVTKSSTPRLFPLGLLEERIYQDNPQTITEFEEAIGQEITSIGSEVTKTVIGSIKK